MQYINTSTLEYPVLLGQIQAAFPNTTWGLPENVPAPYAPVAYTPQPAHDQATQTVHEVKPTVSNGVWAQAWEVRSKTAEELQAIAQAKLEQTRASRQAAYTAEADPIFFKSQRGEATHEEWLAKVDEIRARYP